MRTKFIVFTILILHFMSKAPNIDTLETNKKVAIAKSSVGIGFWNFGSLASLNYERSIIKNLSLRFNIGTNSFLNGNSKGISIGLFPEFKMLNYKNKFYLSVNSGLLYSKFFESQYTNSRSFNNFNMGNYEKGGQTPTYQNHFSFITSLNNNFKLSKKFLLEITVFYFYFKQYQNVTKPQYESLKQRSGIWPSLNIKYLIK